MSTLTAERQLGLKTVGNATDNENLLIALRIALSVNDIVMVPDGSSGANDSHCSGASMPDMLLKSSSGLGPVNSRGSFTLLTWKAVSRTNLW